MVDHLVTVHLLESGHCAWALAVEAGEEVELEERVDHDREKADEQPLLDLPRLPAVVLADQVHSRRPSLLRVVPANDVGGADNQECFTRVRQPVEESRHRLEEHRAACTRRRQKRVIVEFSRRQPVERCVIRESFLCVLRHWPCC